MSRAVLVTGGSGYLGSRIARALAAEGTEVGVLDVVDPPEDGAATRFHRLDLRDRVAVASAVAGYEVVIDCATQVPLVKDRARIRSVIVGGVESLLDAAAARGTVKVVYVSSSAVYGVPRDNPVDESTPLAPADPYGAAKAEAERICLGHAQRGLDVTIVRPRTILGPRRLGLFHVLYEWIRLGRNVPVLGDGRNVYQFVHVDDVVEACVRAARRPGSTAYNVGSAEFGTMREALEELCTHAGTGSRVRSLPRRPLELAIRATSALGLTPLAPYHALMYGRSLYFRTDRLERELGFRPRRSSGEMLAEGYEWYLAHRADLERSPAGSPHLSPLRQGLLALFSRVIG